MKIIYLDLPLYFYFQRSDSAVHTLSPHELLNMTDGYWKIFKGETIMTENSNIIFVEALKSFLAYRYLTLYQIDEEVRHIIKKRKKIYLEEIRKSDLFSIEKIIYTAFIKFPVLYRWYRIHDDRTLLEYEKNQRKKYKSIQ